MANNLLDKSPTSELTKISKKGLEEACKIALKFKDKLNVTYKSESQPVTNADKEIDKYLKLYYETHTPWIGWLSEESIDDKSRFQKDLFWCLDPIDGTRSYINQKPEYTISLALIKKNKPILGYVVNPETKEFFFSEKGKGAFCNDKKIIVKQKNDFNNCNITISSSEIKKLNKYEIFKKNQIIKLGSIAYKIALVAKGQMDIAISFTKKNDWDLAAAHLLLEEAGGKIVQLDGKQITYNTYSCKINSVMAANHSTINSLEKIFNK